MLPGRCDDIGLVPSGLMPFLLVLIIGVRVV